MKKTILTSNWTDNRGIGAVIFALIANLENLKSNEIIYLSLKNLFYSNSNNFWEQGFCQPFEESLIKSSKTSSEKELFSKKINYNLFHDKNNLEHLRKLFKKFIKPKKNIEDIFKNKYSNLFENKKIISLHIRGNAMFSSAHAANQYDKIDYNNYIKPLINKIFLKGCDKIFLCTIDMNFRDKILKDFNDKIIYPDQSFPDNRIHPSFDPLEETIFENEKFKNFLIFEPLIEAFAMSKASYSYCMRSNVSYLSILYRNNFNYEFIDDHVDYSRYG